MPERPSPPLPSPEEIAVRIAALPTLPSIASDLLSLDEMEDMDTGLLARRIAADQALAARALRVANSPFYGLQGQVVSIQEAIVVLGFRAVRSLVISAAAVQALATLKPDKHFDPQPFWRHSIGTAVSARHLALLAGRNPESAFAAGLLHDIGQLVLAVSFPAHYAAIHQWIQRHASPLLDVERQMIGTTHAEAGALLAERWGLPAAIREAIALHHQPDDATADSLADLTHTANVLSHALALATPPDELVPTLSDTAWARLNISWANLTPALDRIAGEFEDTLHALIA